MSDGMTVMGGGLVSRTFTGDELRALLTAWEHQAFGQVGYWSMHTYLAEAIIEADRLDATEDGLSAGGS